MLAADSFSIEIPELMQRHFDDLQHGSGISLEVIRERGYRSARTKQELADVGFKPSQRVPPGMLMPVHSSDGQPVSLYLFRPDFPRVIAKKHLKYEFPKGQSVRIDVPPRCLQDIGSPGVPLWLTEGQKKADALASHGVCAIDLLGVWNFKGRNDSGGVAMLADLDYVAWNGRTVCIVFYSDVMTKKNVAAALDRLEEHLRRKEADVSRVYLPAGPGGSKVGVDDYLLTYTVDDLEGLVGKTPTAPKPADPVVEWLDAPPPAITRPLAHVDGSTYAATWGYMKVTTPESISRDGSLVKHDPPLVINRRELNVVRDDGVVFGPAGPKPLDELEMEINLDVEVPERNLWSKTGVLDFAKGERPDPADVFGRVASVYDRFLDFSLSVASQADMVAFSACFSMTTWFHVVFTVLGYPWPSGPWGAGKTKWGTCWAMTSYLGEIFLESTTFAVLRDLADYGASIVFDDAESLADPRKSDPDKRALLLGGNRVGATIALKEPHPDKKGKWVTRRVNAYCPRSFTSIRLPDKVLGSRSVPIPLAKTANARKGNSDPQKVEPWPCNRQDLLDDLWAMALSLMMEAKEVWAELDDEDEVVGRDFECWRAVFAVARLLDRHGAHDLENRMRTVMGAYQEEQVEAGDDRAVQVLRAVFMKATGVPSSDVPDVSAKSDVLLQGVDEIKVTATELAETIVEIGNSEGFDAEWANARSVGWQLSLLRFGKWRNPGTKKRSRFRTMKPNDLRALCLAYGVIRPTPRNKTSETSRTSETSDAEPEQIELRI